MVRFKRAVGVLAVAALVLAGCSNGGAAEADYPDGSITFIVPFPAGSAPDASSRVIAQELENDLGVSVVVENIEGGGSTIGTFELSQADPDGYTIGLGTTSGISITPRRIDTAFTGLEALTPVGRLTLPANGLFAAPDRWSSTEEFIAEAKANPGQLKVGLPNPGSIQDIQVALLEEAAGIDIEPVYFDAGQQVLPVVNGTIDAAVAQAGPVVQYVDTDKLDWVGFFGDSLPGGIDAPLFLDDGYDTTSFASSEGVFGPAGLPAAITERLSAAVETAAASEAYTAYAAKTYSVVAFLPAAEFAEEAKRLDEAAPGIIDDLGLADS